MLPVPAAAWVSVAVSSSPSAAPSVEAVEVETETGKAGTGVVGIGELGRDGRRGDRSELAPSVEIESTPASLIEAAAKTGAVDTGDEVFDLSPAPMV